MPTLLKRKRWWPHLVPCVGLLMGCSGQVGQDKSPGGGDGTEDEGGVAKIPDGFVGPTSGMGAGGPTAAGPTALRRLTNEEYRNTLADLVGVAPADPLQKETRSNGYDNFSGALSVSATLAGQYEEVAARLARELDVKKLAPCLSSDEDTACAVSFIKGFGKRAFRRPLKAEETEAYLAVYDAGRAGESPDEGIRAVLEAYLASPYLLYRFELGADAGAGKRLLNPYELASLLSYLFTASMPDDALFAAADAGLLTTPAQVADQAKRLLASPRAKPTIRRLFMQWFGLANLSAVNKDPNVYPEFDNELRAAMQSESELFIDDVLWERDASLSTLLTSPTTFINSRLAKLYGAEDPGSQALVKRDLDPTQRAGLLTHASVMSEHAHAGDSFPIARGKFVRKGLLCHELPPPPPSVLLVVPPARPDMTTRERFAQHSLNPACAGCHALIDPLGFGLENYDGIGAYRTMENGMAVDAAGELTGTPDADGPYTGGVELANKLAASRTTAECAVIQATRWAYGRLETDSDKALAASLVDGLSGGKMNLRELLVTLTMTETFFVRSEAR